MENNKWKWEEATDDEFEKNSKTLVYYKIYIILDKTREVVLYKFWAKNDEEARKTLQDFTSEHPNDFNHRENTEGPFYSTSGYYVGHTGKRFDSMGDMMKENDSGFFKNMLDFFRYTIPVRWSGITWKFSKLFYFLKTGRIKGESWDINHHMLELLKYNLPIMIENLNGFPSVLENAGSGHFMPDDDAQNDKGMVRWKKELNSLRYNVLAYLYYSEFGIIDEKDPQMKYIDEKLRDTLPYKPGTNKEFDYNKLGDLVQKHWVAIWDWIKIYGQHLWD